MDRPLVTYMIPAYQQELFIAESVRSALEQTYSPLEILILDDCSRDRTVSIIKEEVARYDGPHDVRLLTNERNLGIQAQVNRAIREAKGRYIVGSAGDDLSMPTRVEKFVDRWSSTGVSGVYSNAVIIDADGVEQHELLDDNYVLPSRWQEIARDVPGFPGCTSGWDTQIFQAFGPLPARGGEDLVAFFRASLLGGVSYIPEVLVKYRRHGANFSQWADDHPSSWARYLSLNNRLARDKQNACGAFLGDLEKFVGIRPELGPDIQRAVSDLENQLAFFEIRERVTAGGTLRTKDLASLWKLRHAFPYRWLASTLGLGTAPKWIRRARTVMGLAQRG